MENRLSGSDTIPYLTCNTGLECKTSFSSPVNEDTESLKDTNDIDEGGDSCEINRETNVRANLMMFLAIILAGFGNVIAGILLLEARGSSAFAAISGFLVLVPSLSGLKGNLEMTMASRLSTQANLGNLNDWKSILMIAKGNIALLQCQATVVAFLASVLAMVDNILRNRQFLFVEFITLCASALITANLVCFILGVIMVYVIIFSYRFKIDPDNVATPIAASVGDITTLAILSCFAQILHNYAMSVSFPVISMLVIILFICLLPVWFNLAFRNDFTHSVVTSGWTPVILAMIISSLSGFILDFADSKYKRITLFQLVINGVGGNLVAIQASRFSTFLHRKGKLGVPMRDIGWIFSPHKIFTGRDINQKVASFLLVMAIPAHLLNLFVLRIAQGEDRFGMTPYFTFTYMIFALLQAVILLYLAHNLIVLLWKFGIDPDSFAIPLLTALGDLIGAAFLLTAFIFLEFVGDINVTS